MAEATCDVPECGHPRVAELSVGTGLSISLCGRCLHDLGTWYDEHRVTMWGKGSAMTITEVDPPSGFRSKFTEGWP